MNAGAKHFISPQFMAANVIEVDLPMALIESFSDVLPEVARLPCETADVRLSNGLQLHAMRPGTKWHSDILWISQNDAASYAYFREIFDQSGLAERVAPHVDHDRSIVLYSGFFVSRSQCHQPNFHADWLEGNNDAFTLLAPLTDNFGDMGLLYRDLHGGIAEYDYQLGKGIVFGDHFVHSTKPGLSQEPAILLCFNFGTDRMDNWPKIAQTTATQSKFYCQPDGTFVRTE